MSQPLPTLNCPRCGAPLPDSKSREVTCKFCGTKTILTHLEPAESAQSVAANNDPANDEVLARVRQLERDMRANQQRSRGLVGGATHVFVNTTRPVRRRSGLFGVVLRLVIFFLIISFVIGGLGVGMLMNAAQDLFRVIQEQINDNRSPTRAPIVSISATATPNRANALPPQAATLAAIATEVVRNPQAAATLLNPTAVGRAIGTPEGEVAPTATPRAVPPVPAPRTPAPPPPAGNCQSDSGRVLLPMDGLTLRGRVNINSDFELSGYEYYKFEVRPEGSAEEGAWRMIYRQDNPSGKLQMSWDTTTIAPGRYQLRFVTVDRTGNFPPPCVITIAIAR